MFELPDVDLSSVYLFDASPLSDVARVGRHKAIGYVQFSSSAIERFVPPSVNLRQAMERLESQGMKLYYQRNGESLGYEEEIAELVQRLPQVRYFRKLRDGYFYFPRDQHVFLHTLIAADPVTIEKLLQANQEALYGFPPTVDAFVALVCQVRIDDRLPLGRLIHLAFAHYQLYGGREIPRLFEPAPTPAARPSEEELVQRFERFADSSETQLRKLSEALSRVEQDLIDAYADLAAYTEFHDHFRAARKRNWVVRLIGTEGFRLDGG